MYVFFNEIMNIVLVSQKSMYFLGVSLSPKIDPLVAPSGMHGSDQAYKIDQLALVFNDKMEDFLVVPDKESACNAGDTGDLGSIPGLQRSPGRDHGN